MSRIFFPVWIFLALYPGGAQPAVTKVEPPDWWAGHSINPVRLLVRGTGLSGATLSGALRASNVKVNPAGTYLFVDVVIPASTKPGAYPFTVRTPQGLAEVPFRVRAPLPAAGRFQGFGPDDVLYLVMPDRFANGDPANDDPPKSRGLFDRDKPRSYHGGDLAGIRSKLTYLKDLGVTAIWLNPWYDNTDRYDTQEVYGGQPTTGYHGYGAIDFYSVDEHLGTLDELKALVDEAHRMGIKVVQDQVANHTGPYHPWVSDPPLPNWFHGTPESHEANTWQTWTLMDRYATPEMRRQTLDGWFINILPDLNQEEPEVSRYLIQNTLWWIGVTGIDGIRQDTWPYVPRSFWKPWMSAIKRQYPAFKVVGELFDADPAMLASFLNDGTKVDSLFDFPLYYAVRDVFAKGADMRQLAKAVARDHLYPDPSTLVTFLGLHDVERFMGERGANADGLRLAFTFLLTARGLPLIYYGDEIAMPGMGDPDNRRDFPGGWTGDPVNAFVHRDSEQARVWNQVQSLARVRRSSAPLRRGRTMTLLATEQQYVYARVMPLDSAVVAINRSTLPFPVDLVVPAAAPQGAPRVCCDADSTLRVEPAGPSSFRLRGTLAPMSAAVLTGGS